MEKTIKHCKERIRHYEKEKKHVSSGTRGKYSCVVHELNLVLDLLKNEK